MAIDGTLKTDATGNRSQLTTSQLAAFWRTQTATHDGAYQKPLTQKEVGQLKRLAKYLGSETESVIAYALKRWGSFASRAGYGAGVSWPSEPHIGFLLKYHAVAVNMMTPQKPTPVIVAPAPKMPSPSYAPREKRHRLTYEELQKLLEELKQG